MRPTTIILSLIALCSIGCQKRTEIVIGVATDLIARGEIDYVSLTATPIKNGIDLAHVGPTTWNISARQTVPENLPGSFGLFTDDGSSQLVRIDLVGQLGGDNGAVLAKRTTNVTLLANQTLFMRMALVARCTMTTGCPMEFNCVEGICRKNVVDNKSLPRYATAMENFISCKSGGGRLATDTADRQLLHTETCNQGRCDAMIGRPDSGGDGTKCGANQDCIEGTCYTKVDADVMCDVVTQAPCPMPQKCDLVGITPICRPRAIMPLTYAASCSDADPDLCDAGQDCQLGSLTSLGMVHLCRRFCMADSNCATSRPTGGDPVGTPRCALAGPMGSGARFCSISCNPTAQTGCPAPYGCQLFPHAMGVDADCGTLGAAGEGASCTTSGDCVAGMGCTGTSSSNTKCRRFCRPGGPACLAGFTCQAVFSTMGVPSPNYGTCCPTVGGC